MIYIIENYIDDITQQSSESPDTAMAPTPGHDVVPSSEDVVMVSLTVIAPNSQASEPADNTYNTILNVTQKKRKKEKLKKTYVMPTWAATKSLLQSGQRVNHTNSEVVATLFKTSPTDYATVYSVLTLTQEISAVVVGTARRIIITPDLYLYERAFNIQQSAGSNRWVLKAGELRLCFAALHGLGKYLEGSGLDTVAGETGIYSPAALRGIYTGKAFKRGVAYHLMNVLACSFIKLDAVVGE